MRAGLLSLMLVVLVVGVSSIVEHQRSVSDYRIHLLAGAGTWWVFSCLSQALPTPSFMGSRIYSAIYYLLNFLGANFPHRGERGDQDAH